MKLVGAIAERIMESLQNVKIMKFVSPESYLSGTGLGSSYIPSAEVATESLIMRAASIKVRLLNL